MRKVVRDENGYCITHPKEYAIPKCKVCLSIYNKEYQKKRVRENRKGNDNSNSRFYAKIKDMGYDKKSIIVMGIHPNPKGKQNQSVQSIPHKVKI